MGLGAEAFTILAILEARDRASEIFEKCGGILEKFGETAEETAGAVKGAADQIDESLLSTASGADAVELAAARVAAARDQVTAATAAQAEAEQQLLAVSGTGAATQEELGAAAEDLAVAQQRAAAAGTEETAALAAQREALAALIAENEEAASAAGLLVDANGQLRDSSGRFASAADVQQAAQDAVSASQDTGSASADALAAANDKVAVSQKAAADAATELSAAQAKQDALGGSGSAADAAANLAAKEKAAQAASRDLAAAQAAQAKVQAAATQAANGGAEAAAAQAAAAKQAAQDEEDAAAGLGNIGKVAGIAALGLGIAGGLMVKAAGNFQDSTQHLVTDAGESAKNLQMVRAGILNISTATGQSAESITDAMYHVESGGMHGAEGLAVLKTVAEGARVGGASLDTTSKALVGTLNAYYGSSLNASNATSRSTSLMNQLVATVGAGDMRLQDLASSLSSVTPVAASAGLSYAQVGGALATMTAQGMSAQQASDDLANMLRNVLKPNATAAQEMRALGISANQVSTSLKGQGLTGVLNEYTQAILRNTQGGSVMLGYYKSMTPAAQALANQIAAGTITTQQLRTATYALNPQQAKLISLFDSASTSATGLKQTYTGALATLTGGATGLNVALMLGGKNSKTFAGNVKTIAAAARDAGGSVSGWSAIQSTFNFKVAQAKTAVENTGIAIGSALLPAAAALVSAVGRVLIPVAEWTAKHKTLTLVIFGGVTALAALVAAVTLAAKAFKAVTGAIGEVQKAAKGIQSVWQKLTGIFRKSAAEQEKAATDSAKVQEDAAAESAAVQEEQAADAAASVETSAGEAAAAEEEAAADSSAGWIASAASTVASWAGAAGQMIASAAKWVAEGALKVGAYVAENVFGAEATETAWTLANAAMLLGIGLVIAAVALAVYEIVTHWKTITKEVSKVWDAVYAYISKIISDVISFVKSHWALIVGIFLGPIALVSALAVQHFTQIRDFCSKIVTDVLDFIKSHWRLIVSILGGPLGVAVALITRYWSDIEHWFDEGTGRVLSILRGLAHDVVSAGEDVVRGIWQGISGMGGWLWGQVKSFASNTLHSFESALGIGSPSKYTTVHGQMLGLGLANGIMSMVGKVGAASKSMAAAALTGTSSLASRGAAEGIGSSLATLAAGPAPAGSGGVTIQVQVSGNVINGDSAMDKFMGKLGKKLTTVTLPASGNRLTIR